MVSTQEEAGEHGSAGYPIGYTSLLSSGPVGTPSQGLTILSWFSL